MSFISLNKQLSLRIEKALGFFPVPPLIDQLPIVGTVADVGGGKKPYLESYAERYIGIDVDEDELAQGNYSETLVADITKDTLPEVDTIICRYTLEHVNDAEKAIICLVNTLKSGGYGYISAPSRNAIFSKLNRILPERLKRRVLHWLYPGKSGDGFPAYYDKASPAEFSALIESAGGTVVEVRKIYFSGYFTFFLPLHLLWRLASLIQMMNENYCERFEIIFKK